MRTITQIQIIIEDDGDTIDAEFVRAIQRIDDLKVLGFSAVGNENGTWAETLTKDEATGRIIK